MDRNYNYNIKNIIALCSVGIVVKLLFGNNYTTDGSNGPASSALWGYGLASMAIFFLMFVQTNKTNKTSSGSRSPPAVSGTTSSKNFTAKMFSFYHSMQEILPTLLMFIVLSWLVILNYQYYSQINKGNVTTEYSQFSNISTIMVIFQMAILFKYIYIDPDKQNDPTNAKYASASYLTALLNIIFIGMMNIIIVYFSTDG
jgi:hypothetical protein